MLTTRILLSGAQTSTQQRGNFDIWLLLQQGVRASCVSGRDWGWGENPVLKNILPIRLELKRALRCRFDMLKRLFMMKCVVPIEKIEKIG